MKALLFVAMALAAMACLAVPILAADPVKRPMQVDDLFRFKRLADPQISPDGKLVVYQVTSVDADANKSSTALWLAAADGSSPPRQLTNPNGKKDAHPRWSPDGKQILFESTRGGTPQLYVINLDGGEATKLTEIATGAGTGIWSPDGTHVAFVSAVYPEFSELPFAESDKKNKAKDEEREKSPVKAKVFTKLFYRHWDSYVEDKRQHLFVLQLHFQAHQSPVTPNPKFTPHDATPGDRDAYPTSTTFSVGDDFTFTPDSKHLVFAAAPDKEESWSTNYDLCRVRITNNQGPSSGRKATEWESLTSGNKAADNSPRFSPDGKKLAWRSQKKAGYEADKWEILVVDVKPDGAFVGTPVTITGQLDEVVKAGRKNLDLSVNEFTWKANDEIALTAHDNGTTRLFVRYFQEGTAIRAYAGNLPGSVSAVSASRDGGILAYALASISQPAEVEIANFRIQPQGLVFSQPSHANDAVLAELDRPRPESVKVKVEDGEMQMWILKPPGFDAAKKWPVVYLVHGGPQSAWEDSWSNRWNPSLWAAQGYIVALPNPRGSTGFGQKFVDDISGDWGGKCYRDLVAGLDAVVKLPYVDKDRIGSAGASFGGYMQNWFAVNDISKRFKCLITHCSVWNFESMWGTTDELWFDEWEHQGLPWEKPGKYAEFSPHKRAGELGKHKTPMLVVHNDLDFRCPIGQGHELFQALQRQGVPSKMVNFPDEGHWVLKPQNSRFWHKEVFGWLTTYVPPGGK